MSDEENKARQRDQCAHWLSQSLCIVIYQTIGPWDLVSSSGSCLVTQWFPAEDEYPAELACHCVCDSLNDFITSSEYLCYCRTLLIHSERLIMVEVISEYWCSVMCWVVQLSFKPWSHLVCAYITSWISVRWIIIWLTTVKHLLRHSHLHFLCLVSQMMHLYRTYLILNTNTLFIF